MTAPIRTVRGKTAPPGATPVRALRGGDSEPREAESMHTDTR